jgi:hypothetical protein
MSPGELRRRLGAKLTPREFLAIRDTLAGLPSKRVFHLLFPIATTQFPVATTHSPWAWFSAAELLLELEPRCPLSCEDSLRLLAAGSWQPSDHLVPFYLVTQFGKIALLHAAKSVARELEDEAARSVETVSYWSEFPSVSTIDVYMSRRLTRLRA